MDLRTKRIAIRSWRAIRRVTLTRVGVTKYSKAPKTDPNINGGIEIETTSKLMIDLPPSSLLLKVINTRVNAEANIERLEIGTAS